MLELTVIDSFLLVMSYDLTVWSLLRMFSLQCFDTVGWVTGRASSP